MIVLRWQSFQKPYLLKNKLFTLRLKMDIVIGTLKHSMLLTYSGMINNHK